jgi:hypothetical protein
LGVSGQWQPAGFNIKKTFSNSLTPEWATFTSDGHASLIIGACKILNVQANDFRGLQV